MELVSKDRNVIKFGDFLVSIKGYGKFIFCLFGLVKFDWIIRER